MPHSGRDAQSDTSKTGKARLDRDAYLYDLPEPIRTVWDDKKAYGGTGSTRGAADIPVAER